MVIFHSFFVCLPEGKYPHEHPSNHHDIPIQVGRKVLGASGDQLVYVDAISPGGDVTGHDVGMVYEIGFTTLLLIV